MILRLSHPVHLLASLLTSALLAGPGLSQTVLEVWGASTSATSTDLPEGSDFTSVAVSYSGGTALRSDGSLVSWGSGALVPYPSGTDFVEIAGGVFSALARRADGTLEGWGVSSHIVDFVPVGPGFTHIAIGEHNGMALQGDGSVTTWGDDTYGTVTNSPTGTGFVQLVAGSRHCFALHSDGTIHAWGLSTDPQVTGVPTGGGFAFIASGSHHSVALRSDGSLVSWGEESGGVIANTPAGAGFIELTAENTHSCAIRSDGTVVSWGEAPGFGVVFQTPTGSGYLQVSTGAALTVAVREAAHGNAYCFGDGTGGTCPCSGYANAGRGCLNSAGTGALLSSIGNARVTDDSFWLKVNAVPASRPGILFRGANELSGGLGLSVGDGLLCTGGQIARSHVQQVGPFGSTTFTDFNGAPLGASIIGFGVPTNYQFWYRDPQNTCSGSGFNFSNAWAVTWLP